MPSSALKKILITGGDGFLAKSFAEKMYEQYELVICNRDKLDLNDANAVKSFLQREKFDVVIHTATYDAAPKGSTKDKNQVLENNLRMFFNLARCHAEFGKMLYFGSGAEFSREHWQPNMAESYFDINVPTDQYGYSKYLMTQYAQKTSNIFNLRLFSVFGEHDDWRYRFISNACCHAVMKLPIHVHNNAIADFLYINDLARIVQWFIDNKPKHQIYNVCNGHAYEYIELANMICEIANHTVDVSVNSKNIYKHYSGDNSLLLEELDDDFKFTPMRDALKSLYSWYEDKQHLIDASKFHF